MEPSTVHVGFCCDERYVQPLAVAVQSLVDTLGGAPRIHFWIVSNEGASGALQPVREIARRRGADYTLLPTSSFEPLLRDVGTTGHITRAAYFRLFLPELLPAGVDRIIYLDSDIVVRRSLAELWAIPLNGHAIAAVMKPRAAEYRDVGLQTETDYFNSGVLVIDVARWRNRRVREAALRFAAHHPGRVHGHDQPALNHVFAGEWQRLDLRWNQQFKFFAHTAGYLGLDRAELRRLRNDPFIVHYTTGSKPWHPLNDHPLRACYFDVLDRTPFAGWRPQAVPWPDRAKRALAGLVPHYARPWVLRNVYRPRYHQLKARLRWTGKRAAAE